MATHRHDSAALPVPFRTASHQTHMWPTTYRPTAYLGLGHSKTSTKPALWWDNSLALKFLSVMVATFLRSASIPSAFGAILSLSPRLVSCQLGEPSHMTVTPN